MEFLKKKVLDDMDREIGDRMAQAYKSGDVPQEEEAEDQEPSLRDQLNSEPLTEATPVPRDEGDDEHGSGSPDVSLGHEAGNGVQPGGAGAQKMEMEGCDPSRLNEEEQAELERLYAKMAD